MPTQIIDYVDKISIDLRHPALVGNHALEYLPVGLQALAQALRSEEIAMLGSRYAPQTLLTFNINEYGLQACYFNWFSVSAINYCRLVALLDFMQQKALSISQLNENKNNREAANQYCSNYSERVIPEIFKWRNKVSAHFAITAPRKGDDLGTLEASILIPVSYIKPYFVASVWRSAGNSSSDIPVWRLTEEYEKLQIRFWPNLRIKPLPGG